ncbi:MAG: hypothetical protein ACREIS_10285 [Nitrospiraceae bacterium]
MNSAILKLSLIVLLLLGLPMLGVALAGKPIARYLEFPPLTRYVEHAPFSWVAFVLLSVFVLAVTGIFFRRALIPPSHSSPSEGGGEGGGGSLLPECRAFPWWGWLGVILTTVAWVLAWSRFGLFEGLQRHTFTPLWIGYILVINALTFRRSGRCMLKDRPGYLLALFPLSAAFWWFFEYLNRFVQNWYYVGISEFSPVEYVWYATPPFSTVLPAVLGTTEWLSTYPRLSLALQNLRPMRIKHATMLGWVVLLLASAGLMGIGIWPDSLFPLLWVSPLLVIVSLQVVSGEETIFSVVQRGDWRPVWIPALAALLCGFFWEMWNFRSLAHWEYAVPFVHRVQLFEMPLLGYAGYLPFGLECVVIASLLPGRASTGQR